MQDGPAFDCDAERDFTDFDGGGRGVWSSGRDGHALSSCVASDVDLEGGFACGELVARECVDSFSVVCDVCFCKELRVELYRACRAKRGRAMRKLEGALPTSDGADYCGKGT